MGTYLLIEAARFVACMTIGWLLIGVLFIREMD